QESRERASPKHEAESCRDAVDIVGLRSRERWINPIHTKTSCERIRWFTGGHFDLRTTCGITRVQEYKAEHYTDHGSRNVCCEESTKKCTQGSGHFQKHADSDVGEAILQVSDGGSRGGSYDRDQGRADGVPDIYPKDECQQRNENDATAESGERSKKSSHEGTEAHQNGELEVVQFRLRVQCAIVSIHRSVHDGFSRRALYQFEAGCRNGIVRSTTQRSRNVRPQSVCAPL